MQIFFIIGLIALVLMAVFTESPLDKARKRREAERAGRSDLIIAIENHNKEKKQGSFGGLFGGDKSTGTGYSNNSSSITHKNHAHSRNPPANTDPNAANDDYYPPPPQATDRNIRNAPSPDNGGALPPQSFYQPVFFNFRHYASVISVRVTYGEHILS